MTDDLKKFQLNDKEKELLIKKLTSKGFLDGCHKYGWIVTFFLTVVLQLVIWSSVVGAFRQSVEDMKNDFGSRIQRIENQVDKILENRYKN